MDRVMERVTPADGTPVVLDYVRLNMVGRA